MFIVYATKIWLKTKLFIQIHYAKNHLMMFLNF